MYLSSKWSFTKALRPIEDVVASLLQSLPTLQPTVTFTTRKPQNADQLPKQASASAATGPRRSTSPTKPGWATSAKSVSTTASTAPTCHTNQRPWPATAPLRKPS
jgi:hypothetical protein